MTAIPNPAAPLPAPGTLTQAVAGHCTVGANKIWLGGAGLDPTGQPIAWVVWGSAHGPYTAQVTQLPTLLAAEALIGKKVNEKLGRADAAGVRQGGEYQPVALDRFPVGAALTAKGGGWIAALLAQAATAPNPPDTEPRSAQRSAAPARVGLAHVLPCPAGELDRLLGDPAWGASQKVNGVRAQIVGMLLPDGTLEFTAWSRTNRPLAVPPAGLALTALAAHTPDVTGLLFILDGEIGAAELPAGSLVIFDYLARQGDLGFRGQPYQTRITALIGDLTAGGIVHQAAPGCPASAGAAPAGLVVLTPARTPAAKRTLLGAVAVAGGEGIILRRLAAPDRPGDTHDVLKHKLQADVDCFATGIKPGLDGGSVRLGLIRPSDGATVEIGAVRLKASDRVQVQAALAAGQQPVLTVGFLPARTVGIQLVEPKLLRLRADKAAAACTTDQLGEVLGDRADLIARAPVLRAAWSPPQTAPRSLAGGRLGPL